MKKVLLLEGYEALTEEMRSEYDLVFRFEDGANSLPVLEVGTHDRTGKKANKHTIAEEIFNAVRLTQ